MINAEFRNTFVHPINSGTFSFVELRRPPTLDGVAKAAQETRERMRLRESASHTVPSPAADLSRPFAWIPVPAAPKSAVDPQLRTAIHESGHCVIALLVGGYSVRSATAKEAFAEEGTWACVVLLLRLQDVIRAAIGERFMRTTRR